MKYRWNFDFNNVEVEVNGTNDKKLKTIINGNIEVSGNVEGIGIDDVIAIIRELKK